MMNKILENTLIESLVKTFPRTQRQINGLQESDAELIRLSGSNTLIALTTDSIVEEIESGLYTDPYLIGWMTVMVNASDLSAVGADPIGILLNETLPNGIGDELIEKLQNGIRDACNVCDIPVLGGDTNFSSRMQMSGTAVGWIPDGLAMTRLGCKPGDTLFATGFLGQGNAYAFIQLGGDPQQKPLSFPYKPTARLKEGQWIRKFASSCMDTSDGALATLDQLMRLNHVGFVLDKNVEEMIHPEALSLSRAANIPPWMMLAGPHGEFELLFTIPPERFDPFIVSASFQEWEPICIGKVVEESPIRILLNEDFVSLDTGKIRNLFVEVNGNIEEFMKGLFRLESDWKK